VAAMNSSKMAQEVSAVVGGEELIAKQSAVDERGDLRNIPIDGVSFRSTRPVPHEDGHVTEVARANWEIVGGPIVQVHTTTTFPGRIRAWGLHQRSTDRLFVVEGLVQIVVFDGRDGSPTLGQVNVFTVSPKNPGLLVIGPNLYHGWKNIGANEAIIINMPMSMYDHEAPDALDLPYGTEAARRIVPFQW
jgi:dTDP-4-dehydrorhamnose 3,5-epimerase